MPEKDWERVHIPDPQPEQPTPPVSARGIAGIAVGFTAPLLLLIPFLMAHDALDQQVPDTATAQNTYVVTAILGFCALAGCFVLAFWLHWGGALAAGLGTLPFGLLMMTFSQDYGPRDGVSFALTLILFMILGAAGLVLGLLWRSGPDAAAAAPAAAGGALSGGFGLASLLLLMDIEDQARMAAEANRPTPGLELVVLIAVLVLGALWWRRR